MTGNRGVGFVVSSATRTRDGASAPLFLLTARGAVFFQFVSARAVKPVEECGVTGDKVSLAVLGVKSARAERFGDCEKVAKQKK